MLVCNIGWIFHAFRVLRLKECDLSGKYKLNLEYRLEASKLNSESSKESQVGIVSDTSVLYSIFILREAIIIYLISLNYILQDANGKVRYSASGREVKLKYTLDDTGLQEVSSLIFKQLVLCLV